MSALNLLAEAVLRLEHKVDIMLRRTEVLGSTDIQPMHFIGQSCPVCSQFIDYTVDVQHQIVVRRCGCKTGKTPSTIPLIPIGVPTNGNASSSAEAAEPGSGAEDSSRREGR